MAKSFWDSDVWNVGKWIIPMVGASELAYNAGKKGYEDLSGATDRKKDAKTAEELAQIADAQRTERAEFERAAAMEKEAQARSEMSAFIEELRGQAAGTGGPSLAQGQLQRATDSNVRQAMAAGQSQRGVGYQANLRSILTNRARAQQESAGQSSLLRNQEMFQGQQMLGNALNAQRVGDFNTAKMRSDWQLSQQENAQRIKDRTEARRQQDAAGERQFVGSLFQTGGALLGGAFGGPMGAAAGGAAGSMLAGAVQDVEPPQDYSDDMLSYKPMAHGGAVPMDSPKRDTVPAMLSPGEIVIPRSVAQSEDAPGKAAEFVAAVKAQKGDGGSKEATLKKILERLNKVEQMAYGGRVC